jgi:hypothetical protein
MEDRSLVARSQGEREGEGYEYKRVTQRMLVVIELLSSLPVVVTCT